MKSKYVSSIPKQQVKQPSVIHENHAHNGNKQSYTQLYPQVKTFTYASYIDKQKEKQKQKQANKIIREQKLIDAKPNQNTNINTIICKQQQIEKQGQCINRNRSSTYSVDISNNKSNNFLAYSMINNSKYNNNQFVPLSSSLSSSQACLTSTTANKNIKQCNNDPINASSSSGNNNVHNSKNSDAVNSMGINNADGARSNRNNVSSFVVGTTPRRVETVKLNTSVIVKGSNFQQAETRQMVNRQNRQSQQSQSTPTSPQKNKDTANLYQLGMLNLNNINNRTRIVSQPSSPTSLSSSRSHTASSTNIKSLNSNIYTNLLSSRSIKQSIHSSNSNNDNDNISQLSQSFKLAHRQQLLSKQLQYASMQRSNEIRIKNIGEQYKRYKQQMQAKLKELYKDKNYWQNYAKEKQERLMILEGRNQQEGWQYCNNKMYKLNNNEVYNINNNQSADNQAVYGNYSNCNANSSNVGYGRYIILKTSTTSTSNLTKQKDKDKLRLPSQGSQTSVDSSSKNSQTLLDSQLAKLRNRVKEIQRQSTCSQKQKIDIIKQHERISKQNQELKMKIDGYVREIEKMRNNEKNMQDKINQYIIQRSKLTAITVTNKNTSNNNKISIGVNTVPINASVDNNSKSAQTSNMNSLGINNINNNMNSNSSNNISSNIKSQPIQRHSSRRPQNHTLCRTQSNTNTMINNDNGYNDNDKMMASNNNNSSKIGQTAVFHSNNSMNMNMNMNGSMYMIEQLRHSCHQYKCLIRQQNEQIMGIGLSKLNDKYQRGISTSIYNHNNNINKR